MAQVVLPRAPSKKYLLAHSMGGAIATQYLLDYPEDFAAAALSAPMFEINTDPLPEALALAAAQAAVRLGRGEEYATGQRPYDPNPRFEGNPLTGSRIRFEWSHALTATLHPSTALGGATFRWVRESIAAIREIRSRASELRMPLLLFQSGRDRIVRPSGQDEVCSRAASCRKVFNADAEHEILMERDELRSQAIHEILEHFSEH